MKIGRIDKERKTCSILFSIFLVIVNTLLLSKTVYAKNLPTNDVIVDVEVSGDNNGQVKAGSEIEINYKLSNLNNIYAASLDFTYDNSLIKVNSIEPGEKISGNVYEAYRDTAKNGNRARYAFTFLGSDEKGLSGKADFVKIKASVLKDGELDVKKSTTKYEFIQKVNNDMKRVDAYFANSQGETVKVEPVQKQPNTGEDKTSNEAEKLPSSKENEEEKVTVLGTNNSTKAVSNEDNNEATEQNSSKEGLEDNGESSLENKENSSDTNLEENEKSENENLKSYNEKEEVNKSNNKNTIIIISIILIAVLATSFGIYLNKKRKS